MLASHVDTVTNFLHSVREGGRSYSTLAVFYAITPYIRRDSGEITCSQRTLAKTAGVTIGDVHRAITRLVELGVLVREAKGKYRVHPSVMWRGQLLQREKLEANAPTLTLLDGGRVD